MGREGPYHANFSCPRRFVFRRLGAYLRVVDLSMSGPGCLLARLIWGAGLSSLVLRPGPLLGCNGIAQEEFRI